ncbi:SMI1/KNR4 family protein [Mesorhizobium sp. L-8-3]|uniref:SMI1/KNR4 family protein n=1 Tax=Mesorhizobium sp. L-8-3 TaxID=2744522 RepID=UPI001928A0A2|nr:SMI1/KNR4 family protein [Mesorhizobium sp. L-8-3]
MPIQFDSVRSLERIEAWVARNHPDRLPFVRPGADACTLQRIEAKFGKALPSEIRLLYAAHDGQPEGAPALYLNQRWLPLDLVAVAWEDLCLRYGAGDELHLAALTGGQPLPHAAIWSASWLPLFGSPRGDHYCIDLRPERPDRDGQVIWFLYDQRDRTVVAQSIGELLLRVADGLDAGKWHLDDGYDGLSD